jgi:hypothetical protein
MYELCIREEIMGRSIGVEHFFKSYMKMHGSYTNVMDVDYKEDTSNMGITNNDAIDMDIPTSGTQLGELMVFLTRA